MTTIALTVPGMTCGNCVKHVTDELTALSAVDAVDVDLVSGGDSTVRVTINAPVSTDELIEAVDEAGYTIKAIEGL